MKSTPNTTSRPGWQTSAACTLPAADPTWWAADGMDPAAQLARAWCHVCPVRQQCLALAMRAEGRSGPESRWGIYGGLDRSERARVAKRRARTKP